MNWRRYVPFVLFAAFYAISLGISWKLGSQKGYTEGLVQGIDAYHNLCYNSEGTQIMDNNTGTVVMCGPMTKVPEQELKLFNGRT